MNLPGILEGWGGRESLGTVKSRIPCDPFTLQQDGFGLDLSTAQQYCPQMTFLACLQPSLDIQNIQQPSCCHSPQGWLCGTAPARGIKLVNLWAMCWSKEVKSPLDIFQKPMCPSFSLTSLTEVSKEKFRELPTFTLLNNLGAQNSSG